ncbi:glycine zipper 2TM domain-containing protein [Piscinibacter sp. XHJ-5]|uniref:glycine zipper 2TM domain-containing protein n=1 Tax=Piscinibacter sp. XHJ-5 TaxID=3037797 RepID=UPI0024535A4B|nr:glycine zipper 2TM domain-containing protein [Piscinibacter sp. XHJ-5]
MTTLTSESTPAASAASRFGRTPWMIAGGLAIAAAGVAAGMAWRPAPSEISMEPTKAAQTETAEPAPAKPAAKPGSTNRPAAPSTHAGGGSTTPLATQAAAVCATCGVVEGVREVEVKGQGTGLGAIGGAVVGGAVGNQVGKGGGRKAMTVLGAIGGGLAGHEIEKRARSEKVYEVKVRMDDGSVRTLTQKTAPTPGSRVTVEGNTLRTTRSSQGEGQMVRTSTGA